MYARFKGLVIERRPGLKPADVAAATDGRVFMGGRAKELGLIDDVGGIREAFAAAKTMAGLQAATLVKYADQGQPPRSLYSMSPGRAPESEINLIQLKLGSGLPSSLETAPMYYLWLPQ